MKSVLFIEVSILQVVLIRGVPMYMVNSVCVCVDCTSLSERLRICRLGHMLGRVA